MVECLPRSKAGFRIFCDNSTFHIAVMLTWELWTNTENSKPNKFWWLQKFNTFTGDLSSHISTGCLIDLLFDRHALCVHHILQIINSAGSGINTEICKSLKQYGGASLQSATFFNQSSSQNKWSVLKGGLFRDSTVFTREVVHERV